MDNQPNPINPSIPPAKWHLTRTQRGILVFGVIAIVILLAAFVYATYLAKFWYEKVSEEANKANQGAEMFRRDIPSNWQTYTNTEYGFEFKYPESWAKVIDLQASSQDYLPMRRFTAIFPDTYPAQDYSARVDVYAKSLTTVASENPFLEGKSSSGVSINGQAWIRIGTADYLVEKEGLTYHISGRADVTKQILSTFRFTK